MLDIARPRRFPCLVLGVLSLLFGADAAFSPAGAGVFPGFIDLLTDPDRALTIWPTAKPGYLNSTSDPLMGTMVTRVADDSGHVVMVPRGHGVWGNDSRHHYSKDQPWNADGTLISIDNPFAQGGSPSRLFLDGETYQVQFGKCSSYNIGDDRWHPSRQHANERINVVGNDLMWYDVVNCVKTRGWVLPFAVDNIGGGEGNPSLDGRFIALGDSNRVLVVDMDPQPPFAPYPSQRIGPIFDLTGCGLTDVCKATWFSVSASGAYVVVSYDGGHTRVLRVDPQTLALSSMPMPVSSPRCSGGAPALGFVYDLGHADLTFNPFDNNEDVLIGQEHCGNRGEVVGGKLIGGLVMVRLRDGVITPLTDPSNEAYPHHVSARNLDRPGWVYVGYYPEEGKRFADEVVAVRLDGSGAVQRFAHEHSNFSGCYRCESHAVPSRDGRRVLWASNWAENCTTCGSDGEIKDYVVDARLKENVEQVGNPSFETNANGWSAYGGSTLTRITGGIDGVIGMSVLGPASLSAFGINDSPNWVPQTPAAGVPYRFAAWVRSLSGRGSCTLRVREYLGKTQPGAATSLAVTLMPKWQMLTMDYVSHASGSTLDLQVLDQPAAASEQFEVDNVSIRRINPGVTDVGPPWLSDRLEASVAPNPVYSSAVLRFSTPAVGPVRVQVFDASGRVRRTLMDEHGSSPGLHVLSMDGRDDLGRQLPSGVYLVRVETSQGTAVRRIAVVK